MVLLININLVLERFLRVCHNYEENYDGSYEGLGSGEGKD